MLGMEAVPTDKACTSQSRFYFLQLKAIKMTDLRLYPRISDYIDWYASNLRLSQRKDWNDVGETGFQHLIFSKEPNFEHESAPWLCS